MSRLPRTTYTFATLEVSKTAYDEIRKKLKDAGYSHTFLDDGVIDMKGIGLAKEQKKILKGSISERDYILTGKELRYAAEHELPVFYDEEYHNTDDGGFFGISKMEKAPVGYYIGDSDINPDEFADDEVVMGNFPEGRYVVYAVKGVKYK